MTKRYKVRRQHLYLPNNKNCQPWRKGCYFLNRLKFAAAGNLFAIERTRTNRLGKVDSLVRNNSNKDLTIRKGHVYLVLYDTLKLKQDPAFLK